MTLPDERYRAVIQAKRFLESLAYDTKTYPRIPKAVRGEAYSILRHFPTQYEMLRASASVPDIFQEKMEPVTRMFAQYNESKKDEQKD